MRPGCKKDMIVDVKLASKLFFVFFPRRGSVIVDFQLIFTRKVDNPLKPLEKVAKTGKLGNMTFEIQRLDGR